MKILGKSIATAEQMSKFLINKNNTPKFSRNITIRDFCQLFLDVAAKENVRGDIAFAQACLETGYFNYKGDIKYHQNNFAGIGATGGGVSGCVFKDIETGILAQVQHLKSYATKDKLNEPNVDPRRSDWFMNVKGGTSPDVETLGGTWAVPGYNTTKYSSITEANKTKDSYGYHIIALLEEILKTSNNNNNMIISNNQKGEIKMSNSSLVTYTKISPNKTTPRNHVIDTITIHCMAGNLSVETCGNVFAPVSRQASSNYGIGSDGRIALYVDEQDRSWCSSNAANDNRAITIEVANDGGAPDWHVSDKAMESLIKLCADICKRNGIKQLIWSKNKNDRVNHLNGCNMTIHRDYANKSCPGDYLYSMHGYIADEVNKLLGSSSVPNNPVVTPVKPTPTVPATPITSESTYTVKAGDTLGKIASKYNTTTEVLAKLNNITNINLIRVGQKINLPNNTYTVKAGQGLWTIAREVYGIGSTENVEKLKTMNGLKDNTIHAGQILKY